MAYTKAIRKAAPVLVEVSGVSGGGKSTTGILLAAGIAGPKGRVGLLDTENGRGSLLATSPVVNHALPDGYEYDELAAPFTPERYIEKIEEAERAGITTLVVDSTSHEYEGIGGICEIAETNKLGKKDNWALAKRRHKRFLYHCLSSPLDLVFCFRARNRVSMPKGSNEVIDLGIQPVMEKNWSFDMTVRWHLEDKSHLAVLLKAPNELEAQFSARRMLTAADGQMLRDWKLSGAAFNPIDLLQKRARATAEDGMETYTAFFHNLTAAEKKILIDSTHTDNKRIAAQADAERAAPESESDASEFTEEQMREWDAKQAELVGK